MIAEHNFAFNASTHMSQLYSHMFRDSKVAKAFQCRQSKTGALIRQVLGPHFHNKVVNMLKGGYFSLMFDETMDQGVNTHGACLVKI